MEWKETAKQWKKLWEQNKKELGKKWKKPLIKEYLEKAGINGK